MRSSGGRAADGAARRTIDGHHITIGDGRSTEQLVDAGGYAYAHSCLTADNVPARHLGGRRAREVLLLEFDQHVTSEDVIVAATRLGLERPVHEDALSFRIAHPEGQRERPVVLMTVWRPSCRVGSTDGRRT